MGHDADIFRKRLSDEQTIKRVAMNGRQVRQMQSMSNADGKLFKMGFGQGVAQLIQWEVDLSQGGLDGDFPSARCAHQDLVVGRFDGAAYCIGQAFRLGQGPDERMGVEQKARAQFSKAAWMSSGRGASKSSETRIRPASRPSRRGAGAGW